VRSQCLEFHTRSHWDPNGPQGAISPLDGVSCPGIVVAYELAERLEHLVSLVPAPSSPVSARSYAGIPRIGPGKDSYPRGPWQAREL
jgi:hypothetical protein